MFVPSITRFLNKGFASSINRTRMGSARSHPVALVNAKSNGTQVENANSSNAKTDIKIMTNTPDRITRLYQFIKTGICEATHRRSSCLSIVRL